MDATGLHSTVDSVCNQLADMIAHLKEIAPEFYANPEKRDSAVLDETHQQAIYELLATHPGLNQPGFMLRNGFPATLRDAIRGWAYYDKPVPFFHLLREIEGRLDIEEMLKLIGEDPFISLNSNRESTRIYILPRVRTIHDPLAPAGEEEADGSSPRHWAEEWDVGINQDLKNIFYIEHEALAARDTAYTIRNIVLTAPILDGKEYFVIALSPVVSDAELDKHYSQDESDGMAIRYFRVQGIKNAERVHQRLRSSFIKACQEGADMVVFPEMLGDAELLETNEPASSLIDSMIQEAEDQNYPAPYLTLMPTWWHDEHNELYIISNKNERLCVQQKQNPFILEQDGEEYMEALIDTNREVQILHIDGLGRITFPICKDLLVPDYTDLLIKTLHSTLVICPSFSPGKTQFDLTSLKGRQYGCYTIWLNTCSAVEQRPPTHLGWIACPYPAEKERCFFPACGGNCGTDSDACLFLVRIGLDREYPKVKVDPHIRTFSA